MPADTFAHAMPFGATLVEGGVRFRLWAPKLDSVLLVNGGNGTTEPMRAAGDGWFELEVPGAGPGTPYRFALPDGLRVPDPASRRQSGGPHGDSVVVDPQGYSWRHAGWTGRPWEEAVIYELHLGTFSEKGTFKGAIEHLDHLAALGATAIELMPLAQFGGRRNWGYDGVLPYAPAEAYGRPEDLKALIDEAHGRGLMVLLDVVYNHFGPDGNYLGLYADFFDESRHTPWGAAIAFDRRPVRDYFIHNALYWLEEYRFDGLRFDAVHAIQDPSPRHILDELAETVRERCAGRHVHLILENEHNEASRLVRDSGGRPRFYDAQWNDDFHNAAHVLLTGEAEGYYRAHQNPLDRLARCLAEGFDYQGDPTPLREGEIRGEPSGHLPPQAFVTFLQNHDQVGNRARGDRLAALTAPERLRALAALHLLAPNIPLLFMGEEWGSTQPFLFFTDFGEDLARLVREGRRAEFAGFSAFEDPEVRKTIPDPGEKATFASSRLDWKSAADKAHAPWLALYRELLALRRAEIVPRLAGARAAGSGRFGAAGLRQDWRMGDGAILSLTANLGDAPAAPAEPPAGRVLFETHPGADPLPGWSVRWSLAEG